MVLHIDNNIVIRSDIDNRTRKLVIHNNYLVYIDIHKQASKETSQRSTLKNQETQTLAAFSDLKAQQTLEKPDDKMNRKLPAEERRAGRASCKTPQTHKWCRDRQQDSNLVAGEHKQ